MRGAPAARPLPVIVFLMVAAGGCAGVPERGPWGESARFAPGWEAAGRAARGAVTDPLTWAPLVAAGLLAIGGDSDDDLSEWAVDNTPLFGDDAADVSDDLRRASTVAYAVTAVIAPSGDDWVVNKARGAAVGLVAIGATGAITDHWKRLSSRERPNGQGDRSFPSGHASSSAVRTTLAVQNLAYVDMPLWARRASGVSLHVLAGATGWARVEGEKHHVSDVLVGFALGHFIGRFMHDTFMESGAVVEVTAEPVAGGAVLRFGMSF